MVMPCAAAASAPVAVPAVATTTAPHDQAIAEFAAALAARDQERERQRERQRRRIKGSRIGLIAGAGVVVIGTAILAGFIGLIRKDTGHDNDSFGPLIVGGSLMGAGFLAMVISGPLFVISRNRLGELGAPQRRLLRLQPSLSAGSRGGQAGLVLDLRF